MIFKENTVIWNQNLIICTLSILKVEWSMKSKVDSVNQKLIRFGGFCGIVGSVLPIIMVFAATIISPWFRWDTNALSELASELA